MTRIKSDRYSMKYKGYLTYPPDVKLNGILLESYFEHKYNISYDGDDNNSILAPYIKKDLAELIENDGGIVDKIRVERTKGRKKLFDIPVEIRKIKNKGVVEGIRIRLTSDSKEDIIKTIEYIKEKMSEYGIKPKECVWQKNDKSTIDKSIDEIVEESVITKIPDCPDCGSSDFGTLNTPRGIRFQCQKCKEIFECVNCKQNVMNLVD